MFGVVYIEPMHDDSPEPRRYRFSRSLRGLLGVCGVFMLAFVVVALCLFEWLVDGTRELVIVSAFCIFFGWLSTYSLIVAFRREEVETSPKGLAWVRTGHDKVQVQWSEIERIEHSVLGQRFKLYARGRHDPIPLEFQLERFGELVGTIAANLSSIAGDDKPVFRFSRRKELLGMALTSLFVLSVVFVDSLRDDIVTIAIFAWVGGASAKNYYNGWRELRVKREGLEVSSKRRSLIVPWHRIQDVQLGANVDGLGNGHVRIEIIRDQDEPMKFSEVGADLIPAYLAIANHWQQFRGEQ